MRLRLTALAATLLALVSLPTIATPALLAQTAHADTVVAIDSEIRMTMMNGLTVDAKGDVFFADPEYNAVREIVAVNGTVSASSTVITAGSGFVAPYNAAVDSNGNVFVSDQYNNAIKEIVAVNGVVSSSSTVNTIITVSAPTALAVDGSGNVYFGTLSDPDLMEIIAVNGAVSSNSAIFEFPYSFSAGIAGLAVDGQGDVFVTSGSTVNEIVAMNGAISLNSNVVNVANAFNQPRGVTVDGSGNVFIGDAGNRQVYEVLAVNGTVGPFSTVTTLGSGFSGPAGVALNGSGNLFVMDTGPSGFTVNEIVRGTFAFPSTAVGSTSTTQTIGFTFDSGGTLASTPYAVLTQGAQGLDFQAAPTQQSDACVTGHTYNSRDRCTVTVQFSPTRPFQRIGAVQLNGATGTAIATFHLTGTGTGPMVTFPSNSSTTTLAGGFSAPESVALDGSGNVFVADFNNNVVKEIVATNGVVSANSAVKTIAGINYPEALIVDGSGNIFVESRSTDLQEIAAVNGVVSPNSTVISFPPGYAPVGVVADNQGNLFTLSGNDGSLNELVAVNGVVPPNPQQIKINTGLKQPSALAIDGSGNLFVATESDNTVREIVAINGTISSSSPILTVSSSFSDPTGLAVDGIGNVFVADYGSNSVKEIVAINGTVSASSPVVSLSGNSSPFGVAVDGRGNLFIADLSPSLVLELDRSDPPSLAFASTPVGSTSSDSPQSVTVQNSGNAVLNAIPPSISVSANFAHVAGSSTTPDCTVSFSLAPNATCNLSLSFMPQSAGAINGSAVLTDNALNALPFATQTIALSGTGLGATQLAFGSAPPSTLTAGGNAGTVTVDEEGANGSIVVSASDTITLTVSNTAGYSAVYSAQANNGVATFNLSNIALAAGSYTYTASFTGLTSATATETVSKATPAVTVTSASIAYGTASTTLSATITDAGFPPSGAIAFKVDSGAAVNALCAAADASTLSCSANYATSALAAGAHTITAAVAADANYNSASGAGTLTVTSASPTIAFSIPNQTYGVAPFQVTATSNSTGAFTYSLVSGPATVTSSGLITITGTGSVIIQASQAASGNYAMGTQNASFTVSKATSTTALSGSVNANNTATLNATVKPQISGTPTGTVTFSNGNTPLATVNLVNGAASYITAAYTGSQSFTAVYNGDANFTASPTSNSVSLSFTTSPTITFTTASSYAYGQSFQATATSNSTGAFTYSLVSGPASVTSSGLVKVTGIGSVAIQANEAAAIGYNAASKQASFTAVKAGSTTALSATAVKSGNGSAASLTATVSPQYTGALTGSVIFYDGKTQLAVVNLTGNTAMYTTPQLTPGSQHSYSAVYSGDSNFTTSTSNTAPLTVSPSSVVSLRFLSTQLVYPLPPVFDVRINPVGSIAPTGTVTIYDGTKAISTYPVYAQFKGNVLGLVLPPLNVGTHILMAVYSGDVNYAPGQSAPVTVTVYPGPVKLTLKCASTMLTLGQTLSCTVYANEGPLPVTGTVKYTVTNWGSGTVTLNQYGQGTISYRPPARGTLTLTATYAAQSNYQTASPASANFVVR